MGKLLFNLETLLTMPSYEIENLKKSFLEQKTTSEEELECCEMSLAALNIFDEPELFCIFENPKAFAFFSKVINNCHDLEILKKQIVYFKTYSMELLKHKDVLDLLTFYVSKHDINLQILIAYLNVPEIKNDLIIRLDQSIYIEAIFEKIDIYEIKAVSFFHLFDSIADIARIKNEKLYYYDNDLFPEDEKRTTGLKYIYRNDLVRKIVEYAYISMCNRQQKNIDDDYIENTLNNQDLVDMLLGPALDFFQQSDGQFLYPIADILMESKSVIELNSLEDKKVFN